MISNGENIIATPHVSIIMTVYNRKFSLFKRAINSVLEQDYPNYSIIIVDDGSKLIYSQRMHRFCVEHESQITYIWHKNMGQPSAINIGIINATGDYLGFIDSDDEYKPDHISKCLENLSDDIDLIASTTENIFTYTEDLLLPDKHDNQKFIHVDECIVFGSLFGKKKVFSNIKFNNVYSSDSDFYERASKSYHTQKLNLRTYKYYLASKDGMMYKEKMLRKKMFDI